MAQPTNVISHWYQLIEDFNTSSLDFYKSVETILEQRQVPDRTSFNIDFREGGVQTPKRVYLRIIRGKHSFDLCAAPFGTGFFFSWWLTQLPTSWVMYLFFFSFILAAVLAMAWNYSGWAVATIVFFILPVGALTFAGYVHDTGGEVEDIVLSIPLLGRLYEVMFRPNTYYLRILPVTDHPFSSESDH